MSNKEIRYGLLNNSKVMVAYDIAASQAFKNLGGKFVKLDASENIDLAASGDSRIIGWVDVGEFTSSSTAGQDKASVNISWDAVYRIPADAAVTKNLIGKVCDLIVTSAGIQQADIGESAEDVIQIVGVDQEDIDNQTVQVRMNANPATDPEGVA